MNRLSDTEEWLLRELERVNGEMAHTLNGRLKAQLESFDDERREVTLRFPLQDWQVNGIGTLHGGMISAMLDLTMCMAVFCGSRKGIPPTVSMTTNFLRPVPMDEFVLVRARVTSLGRRNATAYGEVLVPATGKLAGTAIGTYAILEAG